MLQTYRNVTPVSMGSPASPKPINLPEQSIFDNGWVVAAIVLARFIVVGLIEGGCL